MNIPLMGIATGMMGGGAIIDNFWKYAPTLKTQDILQVSCYGDSIIAGSYNFPNDSHAWTPEYANNVIAAIAAKTVTTGEDYFQAAGATYATASTVLSGTEFTMSADGATVNPRFLQQNGRPSTSSGELYLMTATVKSTGNAGKQVAPRYAGCVAAGPSIAPTEFNFGGHSDEVDYTTYRFVISVDYLAYLSTAGGFTLGLLAAGGEIISDGTVSTGKIKDVTLYKLSKGVSIHNQGTVGADAGDGLTNVASVTGWTPDACIVAYGTNDIRAEGDVATNKAAYLSNLSDIIAALKTASIYPILATIPPLGTDQTNYTHVPDWNAAIKALSVSESVGLWDRWTSMNNGDLTYIADGRHPTEAGYALLGADLANKIVNGG